MYSSELENDKKVFEYHQITNQKLIVEEIKDAFSKESPTDPNLVSLYDIATLIQDIYKTMDDIRQTYSKKLGTIIEKEFKKSSFIIYGINFDKKELRIGFAEEDDKYHFNTITFKKNNNDLYISSSEISYYPMKILILIGQELSKLYDELIAFDNYHKEYSKNIQSQNSKFSVSINNEGVKLLDPILTQDYKENEFCLSTNEKDCEYKYNCNSSEIIGIIKNCEEELFKKIFVNISDCPKWSQELLHQKRQTQLERQSHKQELLLKESQKAFTMNSCEDDLKNKKIIKLKQKFLPWKK